MKKPHKIKSESDRFERGKSGIPLPRNRLLMTIRIAMLNFLPLALCFSYLPVFSFGSSNTTNFELSIAEIYLVVFALISLLDRENLAMLCFAYGKKLVLFFLLPLYALLSAFWSTNPLRAVLTAGLLFVVIFDALQAFFIMYNTSFLKASYRRHLLRAAVAVSIFCWLQCILDVAGVPRNFTGLCEGCTYQAFGFPHPNGFAIEPQFMGGLLIAPALLAIYSFVFEKDRPLFAKRSTHLLIAGFLTATLFLTFSRGAIYSFLVGLGLIFLLQFPVIKYSKKKSKRTSAHEFNLSFNARAWLLVPFALGSLLVALLAQGLFAQVSRTDDTFWSGVTKSIHQLSLGKVDLRPAEVANPATPAESDPVEPNSADSAAQDSVASNASTFSGYVEQSTSFRTKLTDDALDIWNDSPTNLLFGTGLGSAGTKLVEKDPELGIEKEIVQNQYASLLLELGLVGVLLVLVIIFATWSAPLRFDPDSTRTDFFKNPLRLAVTVAFMVSLCFFAGLPNALYVYLLPIFFVIPDPDAFPFPF